MAYFGTKKIMFAGLKGEKGDKGDAGEGVTVVQIPGQSTTDVMSQKASTDAFATKEENEENSKLIHGSAVTTTEKVDKYQTRVTGESLSEQVIDNVKTTVKKIEGDTVKCENLIPYPYAETSKIANGITWTVSADGSVTANGTATATSALFLINFMVSPHLPNGTYTLSGCPSGGSNTTYSINFNSGFGIDTGSGITSIVTDSLNQSNIVLVVYAGTTVSNLIFKPMLVQGSVVKPYQPYFTDLKNASVSGILSANADSSLTSSISFTETELPKFDYIDLQTQKKVVGSGVRVFDGTISPSTTETSPNIYRHSFIFTTNFPAQPADKTIVCNNGINGILFSQRDYSVINTAWIAPPTDIANHIIFIMSPLNHDDFTNWLVAQNAEGTPFSVMYNLETTTETDFAIADNKYTVYKNGSETIQGNDNSSYGAEVTVTQDLDITNVDAAMSATSANAVQNKVAKAYVDTNINQRGIPSGGTTGQVLTKIDGTNYNTQWTTPTKLYKHTLTATITINDVVINSFQDRCRIINNSPTPITLSNFVNVWQSSIKNQLWFDNIDSLQAEICSCEGPGVLYYYHSNANVGYSVNSMSATVYISNRALTIINDTVTEV